MSPRPTRWRASAPPALSTCTRDTRPAARKQVYADIIASGLSLFGSPRTVADKLARLADMGLDHVMSLHNFGLLSQDLVLDSMRGLMEEAMPLSGVASAAAQPA